MQAVTEKTQIVDVRAYEGMLRRVLSTTEVTRDNGLADWIDTGARAEDRAKHIWRCRASGNNTHGVATRAKTGGGIPLDAKDYDKAPYVHAIHALPAPYPEQLRGAYGPEPSIAEIFSVAHPVLGRYRETKAKLRAAGLIQWYLRREGGETRLPWEFFGMTKDDWPDSCERKAWNVVRRHMRDVVAPAIEAWVIECRQRGLDV